MDKDLKIFRNLFFVWNKLSTFIKIKLIMGKIKVNSTNRWTDKEFATLRKLHGKGMGTQEIADEMGRSFYSVSKKVSILGLGKKYAKGVVELGLDPSPSVKGKTPPNMMEKLKEIAKKSGHKVVSGIPEITEVASETPAVETKIRDTSKKMTKLARQIARANGKRITMALFFVEDL